jgi:class 3 adenylate cyclase
MPYFRLCWRMQALRCNQLLPFLDGPLGSRSPIAEAGGCVLITESVAIMFADVVGSTELSQHLSAEVRRNPPEPLLDYFAEPLANRAESR